MVYIVFGDIRLEIFGKMYLLDNISEIMFRLKINYCMVFSIIFFYVEFCFDEDFRNRVLIWLDYV